MNSTDLALNHIRLIERYSLISLDQDLIIQQLQEWGLLQASLLCPNQACKQNDQQTSKIKDSTKLDKYKFRCSKCKKTKSLREDSIFQRLKTPLPILFRIIFLYFTDNSSITRASDKSPCSRLTVKRIFRYLRIVLSEQVNQYNLENQYLGLQSIEEIIPQQHIQNLQEQYQIDIRELLQSQQSQYEELNQQIKKLNQMQINDNQESQEEDEEEQNINNQNQQQQEIKYISPAVEIDESLFTHILPRNRCIEDSDSESEVEDIYSRQCWILGVYDRAAHDIRAIAIVNYRSQDNIRDIVIKYVATSRDNPTRVYTDKARLYSFLEENGYIHHRLNHGKGFSRGVQITNQIESIWAQKKKIGRFSSGLNFSCLEDVQQYLNEVIWRYRNRNNCIVTQLAQLLSAVNPYSFSIIDILESNDEENNFDDNQNENHMIDENINRMINES